MSLQMAGEARGYLLQRALGAYGGQWRTKVRLIDSFFPVAKGGTYCIPGPFGAGKTVLQHTTSKYADVDIVIIAACGERAGEVVETLTEFPELVDPKDRAFPDGAHHYHLQYVFHAGCPAARPRCIPP